MIERKLADFHHNPTCWYIIAIILNLKLQKKHTKFSIIFKYSESLKKFQYKKVIFKKSDKSE